MGSVYSPTDRTNDGDLTMPAKGKPASPAQREAAKRNLAAGAQKRKEMLAAGGENAATKWSRLLDGTLTVRELSDDEINNMKVKGLGGSASRRRMPSHLAQAFSDERHRRNKEGLAKLQAAAVEVYRQILTDPEEKSSERLKAARDIIERLHGKTPDVVRHQSDNAFERAFADVVVVRDLDDLTNDSVDVDGMP